MASTTFIMANATAQQTSDLYFPGMMLIIFAIFYVTAIRPQRRREKERKELLNISI